MGTNQARGSGPDDNHVTLNEPVELLIKTPGDLACDIRFTQARYFTFLFSFIHLFI
jgi:hypothetical protein